MEQHVPAVPVPTNEHIAVRGPEQDVGLWDLFDKKVADRQSQASPTIAVEKESRRFFDSKLLERDEDPLTWWKDNEKHYKILCKEVSLYSCNICPIGEALLESRRTCFNPSK